MLGSGATGILAPVRDARARPARRWISSLDRHAREDAQSGFEPRGERETIYRRWHSKGAVVLDAILSQVGEIIRFPDSGDVAADLRAQRWLWRYRSELVPLVADVQAQRTIAEARLQQAPPRPHLTPADIERVVAALGDIAAVLAAADPAKKAETYAQLRVTLTYRPDENTVTAEARPGQNQDMYVRTCPRGTDPVSPHCSISYGSDIDLQQTDGPYAL